MRARKTDRIELQRGLPAGAAEDGGASAECLLKRSIRNGAELSFKDGPRRTAEHEDGYMYDARFTTDSTVNIHISAPMLADLAGTISASSLSVQTYVESDEWDFEDTDFGAGNIPSSAYLEYKEDGEMLPQGNGFEDDDCDGDECELQVTDACDQVASPFTAKHVEGDDVLLFNDWKEDGQ